MYQWLTLSPWRAAPRCYLTTHAWLFFFFLIFFETHSSSLSQILWSYLCFSSAALRVSLRAPRGFARWRCSTQRPAPTSPRGSASLGPTELGSCRQAGAVQTPRYPCRSQARLTVTPPQFPQQRECKRDVILGLGIHEAADGGSGADCPMRVCKGLQLGTSPLGCWVFFPLERLGSYLAKI